jgi:hypothetical protein
MAHFYFSEAAHRYSLIDGTVIPSVTQILDAAGMSPDLSHLPVFYRERGRAIHRAMALHLHGTLDESTLDERIRPFVEHGKAWLQLVEAVPVVVEHRWCHQILEYGGTLDLFCRSKLGPLLVDWKSTFYDESYAVQVAGGYQPLLIEAAEQGAVNVEPDEVRAARMAVVVLKPKIPKPHWCPVHNNAGIANAAIFQAALTVAKWRQALRRFDV